MSKLNFADRICDRTRAMLTVLCVGCDPQLKYMPPHLVEWAVKKYGSSFEAVGNLYWEFARQILDATWDLAVCVKPNQAFYKCYGIEGMRAFYRVKAYAEKSGLPFVEDCKWSDGGDTAQAYADGYLGTVPFFGPAGDLMNLTRRVSPTRSDCVTAMVYIGQSCVSPAVKAVMEHGTGVFFVDKTSFDPNSEVEQLIVKSAPGKQERRVWEEVAGMIQRWGEGTEGIHGIRSVGAVVGATYPEEAKVAREIMPTALLLKPGYGNQGGGAAGAVIGINEDGFGVVVNTSRGVLYAYRNPKDGGGNWNSEEFAVAARVQALKDRLALATAAKNAGCWPYDLPATA